MDIVIREKLFRYAYLLHVQCPHNLPVYVLLCP